MQSNIASLPCFSAFWCQSLDVLVICTQCSNTLKHWYHNFSCKRIPNRSKAWAIHGILAGKLTEQEKEQWQQRKWGALIDSKSSNVCLLWHNVFTWHSWKLKTLKSVASKLKPLNPVFDANSVSSQNGSVYHESLSGPNPVGTAASGGVRFLVT